jgi:hypothetical protein
MPGKGATIRDVAALAGVARNRLACPVRSPCDVDRTPRCGQRGGRGAGLPTECPSAVASPDPHARHRPAIQRIRSCDPPLGQETDDSAR